MVRRRNTRRDLGWGIVGHLENAPLTVPYDQTVSRHCQNPLGVPTTSILSTRTGNRSVCYHRTSTMSISLVEPVVGVAIVRPR